MAINPYESPQIATDRSALGIPRWRVFLFAMSSLVSIPAGVVGIVLGFVFWSQFFWTYDERPIDFLSPTGVLLTFATGLCFAIVGGVVAVSWCKRLLR